MRNSELPVNVLLVMDEPNVFDIRERLADTYDFWAISSVPSAQKAMHLLEQDENIDAVVAGSRIADSDGKSLLESVRQSYPRVARLTVSQSTLQARALEAAGTAHATVPYPIEAETLQFALERSVAMRWKVNDPSLQKAIDQLEDLPTPPASVMELASVFAAEQVEVHDIARVIKSDPAMVATLLQFVNSAAFGLPQRMTDVDQIVAYLGLTAVRNLLTAGKMLETFEGLNPAVKDDVDLHRQHAVQVAEYAQNLLTDRAMRQDVYVAGLLHDVGLLALMVCSPVKYAALRHEVVNGQLMEHAEQEVVGTSHTSIGAYLLEQWLLPAFLVEAVGRSHDADHMTIWKPDVAHAVFAAEVAVSLDSTTSWWEAPVTPPDAYYDELGWVAVS